MATYGQIQGDLNTMNEAQRNDATRAAGYTGYNDYMDNANRIAEGNNQGQTNAQISNPGATPVIPGGGGMPGGLNIPTPAPFDLQGLYNSLTQSSGIKDLENKAMQEQTAFNEAQSKINDNPFLSEADRVGRIQKLQIDYNANAKSTQDALAMKKADIQTQLDMASRQYDINSQAARDALSRFDSLLASGALAGASGSDIANLTSQTGLSSSMIQAAINAAKAKNVQTQTINWDDGTNMGFAIIDSNTGEIIKKQTIGPSTPTAAESKAAVSGGSESGGGGGGLSATQQRAIKVAAGKALQTYDTNKDKAVSIQEFAKVVQDVMRNTGVDYDSAYDYSFSTLNNLGYKTWNWSKA